MQAATSRKPRQALLMLSFFLLAALSAPVARAQRQGTVTKSAEISAFAGFTNIDSDYGDRNSGFTLGADYTRFFHFPVAPSFEVRANHTSGMSLTEESILFGLRFEAPIHRYFHPYGTALIGGTKIIFKVPPYPTYTYDQTSAYSLGGGIDIDVARNFRAKFEYQQQFEDFGPNYLHDDFTLTPHGFTAGVVYRIPFKARQGYK